MSFLAINILKGLICCFVQTFADLGLTDVVVEACKAVGWKKPSKIQEEAIPVAVQVASQININSLTETDRNIDRGAYRLIDR